MARGAAVGAMASGVGSRVASDSAHDGATVVHGIPWRRPPIVGLPDHSDVGWRFGTFQRCPRRSSPRPSTAASDRGRRARTRRGARLARFTETIASN